MLETDKYQYMAEIIKAMAHSSRLLILDKLREREYCVCELQELIGADMSTVSRHLAVLRNAGIIDSRKHNNQVFYSLLCPCVLDIFSCVMEVRKQNGRGLK